MIRPYVVTIHDMANLFFEFQVPIRGCSCAGTGSAAAWCAPAA